VQPNQELGSVKFCRVAVKAGDYASLGWGLCDEDLFRFPEKEICLIGTNSPKKEVNFYYCLLGRHCVILISYVIQRIVGLIAAAPISNHFFQTPCLRMQLVWTRHVASSAVARRSFLCMYYIVE